MGFWIFMLIMCLLFPVIMIFFGRLFLKSAPKEINYLFGYRTDMSMKNRNTWEFAHKYIGKLWFYCGIVSLPISIIPLLLVVGKSKSVIGSVGLVVCTLEMIVIIGTIFPTEKALKKNFDKDGNRIKH